MHTGDGGLLFDRCRILQYTNGISSDVVGHCRRWLDAALTLQRRRYFTA
jgi:hypothetical protein